MWTPLAAQFFGAFVYATSPSLGLDVELSLAGGEQHEIAVTVPADQQRLVSVEQLGIDVELECEPGIRRNSPTGRLGFEAAILSKSGICVIHPRMERAKRGRIRLVVRDLSTLASTGRDIAWSEYVQATRLNGENREAREAALDRYEIALDHSDTDSKVSLSTLVAIANLKRRTGDQVGAIELYVRARLHPLAQENSEWVAALENAAGQSWILLSDFEEARRAFESALQSATVAGDAYQFAAAKNNLCLVMHHLGQLAQAATCYAGAAEAYRAAEEPEQVAVVLMNWAAAARQLGNPDEAIQALDEAIAIRRVGPYQRSLALVLMHSANLHGRVGDWERALSRSAESERIFRAIGELADVARICRLRGQILAELGQTPRAQRYFDCALEGAEKADEPDLRAQILDALAANTKEPRAAIQLRESAIVAFREGRRPERAATQRLALALLNSEIGELSLARDELAQFHHLPKSTSSTNAKAEAAFVKGSIRLAEGQAANALIEFGAAEMLFTELRHELRLQDVAILQAKCHLLLAAPERARDVLLEALKRHSRLLALIPSPSLSGSYLSRHTRWKDEYLKTFNAISLEEVDVQDIWRNLSRFAPAVNHSSRTIDRSKLRDYRLQVSLLQSNKEVPPERRASILANLENLDSQFELATGSTASASEYLDSRKRSSDSLRIRYVISENHSWALWKINGRYGASPIGTRKAIQELSQRASADRNAIEELARLLLPDEALTEQVRSIEIVADEFLYGVPFPTLTHLRYSDRVAPPTTLVASGGANGLASALIMPLLPRAAMVRIHSQNGAPLPGVIREQQFVRHTLGKRLTTIDVNSEQTKVRIPKVDFVHIAAHGWTDPERPWAQALSDQSPANADESPHLLLIEDIEFNAPPTAILLNACDASGGTDPTRTMNLASLFARHSGATIIAPVEPVDDALALQFGKLLIEALPGRTPAQAVQHALAALHQEGVANRWVPWQVVAAQ